MSINLRLLLFLPLIFIFLPSMYINTLGIPIYSIIIIIIMPIFVFSQKITRFFKYIFKYKQPRYLFIYVLWSILSGLILVKDNYYNINDYLYGVWGLLILNNIMWYLLPISICPKFISINKIKNFLLLGIYIISLYGLIIFLLNKFNINTLNFIQDIINNRRNDLVLSRNLSVFEEPGYFGGFICINLPLIYQTVLTKYKIIKKHLYNKLIKNTFIPLIWITIITIKSPIWLIFSIISTIIYFYSKLNKLTKKYLLICTIITIPFIISFTTSINTININGPFLKRILLVTKNITKLEQLISEEPSLANRILSYKARYNLMLEKPLTGVGYKNAEKVVINYFKKNHSPLTIELKDKIRDSYTNNNIVGINGAILWDTLSNTGIIGFILLYAFYISNVIILHKISKNIYETEYKNFIDGIKMTLVSIICFSFYDIRPNFIYFWFLFGLVIPLTKYYEFSKKFYLYNKKG